MRNQPNRRRFLQAGAVALGGYFTSSSLAASRLANERLQLGVIGVGNHGATNLAAVRDEAIVALCDVDERYLAPAAERYPEAKTFRDLREVVALPSIDAVVISTPDHTHAVAALAAMQRGKHVFLEKPLTHTWHELNRLLAAARKYKVATQTGMQHHVRAGTRQAAAILRSGMLGDVRQIHAWTDRPIWPQAIDRPRKAQAIPKNLAWNLWLGPAPERPYHEAYHPLRWRGWYDFGSGALGDFGPHLLDAVFWGLELPAPSHAAAETSERHDETFPASSRITFSFPETDQRPAIELVWYDGGRRLPRELLDVRSLPPNGVLVVGSRQSLFIPDYGQPPKLLGGRDREKTQASVPEPLEAPDNLHQDWLAACKMKVETCLPFAQSAPLMRLCLLGNLAIRTGERVALDAEAGTIAPAAAARLLERKPRDTWELPEGEDQP